MRRVIPPEHLRNLNSWKWHRGNPRYGHDEPSISYHLQHPGASVRPPDHVVWTWPEGLSYHEARTNISAGNCWCGRPPGQYTWACTPAHSQVWWKQHEFWRDVRSEVIRRDGNACTECGWPRKTTCRFDESPSYRCAECGRTRWDTYHRRTLQVDHIVAITDGGSPWDRNNLRTLCSVCHAKKTGRDSRRRAGRIKRARTKSAPLEQYMVQGE